MLFQPPDCATCVGGYTLVRGACTPCDKGYYGANNTCYPCNPGNFSANLGQTECTPCPAGKITTSTGQEICQLCGTGYLVFPFIAAYIDCHFGASDGLSECSECAAGSYQNLQGQSFCKTCDTTSYSSTTAAVSCQECPANSRANFNYTGCICQPGYFPPEAHDFSCVKCIPGGDCSTGVSL